MTPVSAIDEQRPCRQDARKSSGFYFNGHEVCCFCGVLRDKHRHSTLVKAA